MKAKKIFTFILILITIFSLSRSVFGFTEIWEKGKDWVEGGSTGTVKEDEGYKKLNEATNIIWGIGIFVVLIGGVALGIRFMLVGGVEERAEIKKQMMPYIVGMVIIFGALTIWKIIVEFMEEI